MCFVCLLAKQHADLSEKRNLRVADSINSGEALPRQGGKIRHRLILTFSVTFLPRIIKIYSCMSKLQRDK